MNDSLSVGSTNSSSTNSNSNSLNRSLFMFTSVSSSSRPFPLKNRMINGTDSLISISSSAFHLNRRRARSQVLFEGDDLNTLNEQNKQLVQDLIFLKKQLKEKDDMIVKLNEIRNSLESEIQELSASLFEEAHLMVNTAKAEAALSEKLLKEANGKIDVLQAEVKALKELVLTSTPSTPNKHLHPHLNNSSTNVTMGSNHKGHSRQSSLNQQILNTIAHQSQHSNPTATSTPSSSSSYASSSSNNTHIMSVNSSLNTSHSTQCLQQITTTNAPKEKVSLFKSHKRVPSQNDLQFHPKSFIDKLFSQNQQQAANLNDFTLNDTQVSDSGCISSAEFNHVYFKEIVDWKDKPELKKKGAFMERVYKEDIIPCLCFSEDSVSEDLLISIETNCVCIEDLTNSQLSSDSFPQKCGLSHISSICQYKIRLFEHGQWILISKLSRNRIISVCDFFTYLRYIKNGIVKCDINEIYWNIIDLRKKMSLSRLGL